MLRSSNSFIVVTQNTRFIIIYEAKLQCAGYNFFARQLETVLCVVLGVTISCPLAGQPHTFVRALAW